MKYKALFLDFDNTIIGTENSNFYIFRETVEALVGRKLMPEDGRKFAGHTWKGIFRILSDEYLQHMSAEEIRAVFIKAKTDHFRTADAPIAEGLADLLELDIKKAIVTGSCRAEVDLFSHIIPLEKFDLIATDELYEGGKPAPDGYLFAASYFGLKPSECVAVEDSVIGITSAKSAGCFTVFSREFADEDHSAMADMTVSVIKETAKLFQSY